MKLTKSQARGIAVTTVASIGIGAMHTTTTVISATVIAGSISSKAVIINGTKAFVCVVPTTIAAKIITGVIASIFLGVLAYNILKSKK